MWLIFVFAILAIRVTCHMPEVLYSWEKVDYTFPNESMRAAYIASGDFVPKENLPFGVTVWREKMFITVVRWKKGVASNLNYISMSASDDKSPKLTPYPSWKANDIRSSAGDTIINVFRTSVDACDRLWCIDTGIEDMLGEPKLLRPLRIIAIDLHTDQIIRVYTLKDSDQNADAMFVELVVDVEKDSCDNAHVYLSDLGRFGLVVYSWAQNNSWRFHHDYFRHDPLNCDFNVTGINFHWTDGILGMTLSPPLPDGSKTLYFHSVCGIHEYSVPTSVLKNEELAAVHNYHMFKLEGEKGPATQGTSSAMDPETGIIYFIQINRHGIACWDTSTPLSPSTFRTVSEDNEKLAFPTDLTVDPSSRKLYTVMSNVPKLMYGSLCDNDKYYVYRQSLDSETHHCKA